MTWQRHLKTSGSTEPLAQSSECHEMAHVLSLHPMDVCSQKAQSDSNSVCSTSKNSRLKAGADPATWPH